MRKAKAKAKQNKNSENSDSGFNLSNIKINSRHYDPKFKDYILDLVAKGAAVADLAAKWKINTTSIYAWVNTASKNNSEEAEKKGPKSYRSRNSIVKSYAPEVKFCPCCGTDIRAVVIALETTVRM
jgi:transposase-like protein